MTARLVCYWQLEWQRKKNIESKWRTNPLRFLAWKISCSHMNKFKKTNSYEKLTVWCIKCTRHPHSLRFSFPFSYADNSLSRQTPDLFPFNFIYSLRFHTYVFYFLSQNGTCYSTFKIWNGNVMFEIPFWDSFFHLFLELIKSFGTWACTDFFTSFCVLWKVKIYYKQI